MPVSSVVELYRKSGDKDREGNTYERRWLVTTSSANDGPSTVLGAAALPAIGATYTSGNDSDTAAYLVSLSASDSGDDRVTWEVAGKYEHRGRDQNNGQDANPINRPTEYEWSFAQHSKVVEKAERIVNGVSQGVEPVANSAGELYADPPLERDESRPLLTVRRNEASFSAALAMTYADKVNSDTFYGVAAGYAKIQSIGATKQFAVVAGVETSYWSVTYQIQFNVDGYDVDLPDRGTYVRDWGAASPGQTAGGAEKPRDKTGAPVQGIINLDGGGNANIAGAATVYRTFRLYSRVAFAPLNL